MDGFRDLHRCFSQRIKHHLKIEIFLRLHVVYFHEVGQNFGETQFIFHHFAIYVLGLFPHSKEFHEVGFHNSIVLRFLTQGTVGLEMLKIELYFFAVHMCE